MAKSNTTLKPGDNLPARGRAYKTILLDVLREESQVELTPESTREQAEKAFIKHAAERAFNKEDNASSTILNEFMKRSFPPLKPTSEPIKFDFPVDGTATEKALSVIEAISNGDIPVDIGQTIVGIIKDTVVIEEGTDLKERIAKLEALVNE